MGFKESNEEGKIGEKMYADYLTENNINFIDVSNDLYCRLLDMDFIIPKENYTKNDILSFALKADPYGRKERQQKIGYTVEVKLDKVIHNRYIDKNGMIINGTGNLVYEDISHNMPGCLARSYADFVLYVCVDTFDYYTILKKAYMINLYKWRETMIKKPQFIKIKALAHINENGVLVKEDILNKLYPVEILKQEKNTISDFTQKVEKFFPKNLIL